MRRLLLFRPADGSKKRPVVEEGEGGWNRGENARERARVPGSRLKDLSMLFKTS